jgi:hypothetical protein
MEYYDFNKVMERGTVRELLVCAGNCRAKQEYIEEQIEALKSKLDDQKMFEDKLREKANKL